MDVAGGPELLSADVLDSTGALITTRVRIAWSSTDTSVVRVDETGTLQPRNVGFSTIHAVVDANGAQVQDSIVVDVFRTTIVLQSPPSSAGKMRETGGLPLVARIVHRATADVEDGTRQLGSRQSRLECSRGPGCGLQVGSAITPGFISGGPFVVLLCHSLFGAGRHVVDDRIGMLSSLKLVV